MLLQTLRSWAQTVVYAYLLAQVAWWLVVGGLGTVLVIYFLAYGYYGYAIGTGVAVFGALAMLGFLAWMTADARQSLPEAHRQHLKEEPGPRGDMTSIAGGPAAMPPWMGTGAP